MLPIIHKLNGSTLVDNFFNNDLFDGFLNNKLNRASNFQPAVNIIENKNDFVIEIASPGLKKEDFKVNVHNDLLTISYEKKSESDEKEANYIRREFFYSKFEKSFVLPESVNSEQISASSNDGIITINIPKKEEEKAKEPRQISIN